MAQEADKAIRRSYSIPRDEQSLLDSLPDKFPQIKPKLNKSEIIRLSIKLFAQKDSSSIKKMVNEELERLNVGKPKENNEVSNTDTETAEITVNDKQWRDISKLIPPEPVRAGKPKNDDRQVLNGILYVFRYEKQRRNVPQAYSSYSTCRRRLTDWRKENIWQAICHLLIKYASNSEEKRALGMILLRSWIIDIDRE